MCHFHFAAPNRSRSYSLVRPQPPTKISCLIPCSGTSSHLFLDARTLPSSAHASAMLNPRLRESTRENAIAGTLPVEFLAPPVKTSAKRDPGNFNLAVNALNPFISNSLIGYSGRLFPSHYSSSRKAGFGPAHIGQMPLPARPFAIYDLRQPGATLVLPGAKVSGFGDPKSPAVAHSDGKQRSL